MGGRFWVRISKSHPWRVTEVVNPFDNKSFLLDFAKKRLLLQISAHPLQHHAYKIYCKKMLTLANS